MFLKTWRFLALVLSALALGMAFCHLLEMPAKMRYEPELYVRLHRTLYAAFGPPNVGAFLEPAAVLVTGMLVLLVRGRRPAFGLTLAAAGCMALAFPVVFFAFTEPANTAMRAWPLNAVPERWEQWRDQWEFSHAARCALHLAGFCLLALSVLAETPVGRPGAAGGPA